LRWGCDPVPRHPTALLTAQLMAVLITTRAMISDPKLPFANDSTSVGELKSPAGTSIPVVPVQVPVSVSRLSTSLARLWLRRLGVLLFVFLCATLGVMLMILPWRPEWSDNPLLLPYPTLRTVVASGFARGLSTGLGVINVWIGFWEAIQYREEE
jgi:hypothetical protein